MSGSSDTVKCPNCGAEGNRYTDWKPYDVVSFDCFECGFYVSTQAGYLTLDELNGARFELQLPNLLVLPKREFNP